MAKVSSSTLNDSLLHDDSGPESDVNLKVLIAYERSEDGLSALRLYQRLVRRFDQEILFDVEFRRFEVLSVPGIRERAVGEAVEADLVVIAMDGSFGLSAEFQSWIDLWIEKKVGQDCALVLLSRHSCECPNSATSVHSYLRNAALRGNMAFIADTAENSAAIAGAICNEVPDGENKTGVPHPAHLEGALIRLPAESA